MIQMKTKILVIVLFTAQFSFAQNNGLTAEQIATYQNNMMTEELDLTENQIDKVSTINMKYSEKQKALMEEEGSMFGKIGRMKDIKKDKDAELEDVLTEAQFEKYKDDVEPKIRSFMRKNMKK